MTDRNNSSNQCAYCGYEDGKHNEVCTFAENERLRNLLTAARAMLSKFDVDRLAQTAANDGVAEAEGDTATLKSIDAALAGSRFETSPEQKYSEKDVAAITAAIDAAREAKSVTGECVGGRATLGGNDIMLLKVPSGSYGIGVRYAIRAVKTGAEP